jgi:secreted PhoX family phosphatase
MKKLVSLAVCAAIASSGAMAVDFGQKVEQLAKSQTLSLFGTLGALSASSGASLTAAQAETNPAALITVAPGLSVRVVSAAANLSPSLDQMALYPAINPTHIIGCNEQGSGQVAVQRINIATGIAENIISSGMTSCDPIRVTPWGTIIAAEENGPSQLNTTTGQYGTGSRVFEILDPLTTTNVTVPAVGFGASSDPTHVAPLPALGTFSFEGFGILPNGVMYQTDENRPGTGGIGNPGGAIVKFIPTNLWVSGSPAITDLAASPFQAGRLFGLRIGRNSNNTDVGQGNEFGRGRWVEITGTAPIDLRTAAASLKLTSYYRPEDMSVDQKQIALGKVRFCGTNTGQDTTPASASGDNHYGEVYCVTDGTIAEATTISSGSTLSIPEYQPLILGNPDFGMPDNLDIQPGRGNFIVDEDGDGAGYSPPKNNDIWMCLDDGADLDKQSDGCIKVITLNDLTAEPTGGFFDPTGTHYYVSVQHNITGHGVLLDVYGWQ